MFSTRPTEGAQFEQPPPGAQPPIGAQPGAQPGSQAGAQTGAQGAGAFAPRNKHDSQPTAGTNKTKIAVKVNSLRMICSLLYPARLKMTE